MANHYETLSIKTTATAKEIKTRFRSLAKELHPDLGNNADEFRKIRRAYEVLSDPDRRAKYDKLTLVVAADEADKQQKISDDPWGKPASGGSTYWAGVWNLPQGAPMPYVPMGTAYPHSSGSAPKRQRGFQFSIPNGQPGSALDVGDTAWIDNHGGLSLVNSANYQEVLVVGRTVSSSRNPAIPTIVLMLEDAATAYNSVHKYTNKVMASGSPANFKPTPAQQAFFGQSVNVNISTQSGAANPSLTMAAVKATINKLAGSMAQAAFAPWTGQKYEIEVPYTKEADSFNLGDELWLTQSGIQTKFAPQAQRVIVTRKDVNLGYDFGMAYSISFTLEDSPTGFVPVKYPTNLTKHYGTNGFMYTVTLPYNSHSVDLAQYKGDVWISYDSTHDAEIYPVITGPGSGNYRVRARIVNYRTQIHRATPPEIELDLEEITGQPPILPINVSKKIDKNQYGKDVVVYTVITPNDRHHSTLVRGSSPVYLRWGRTGPATISRTAIVNHPNEIAIKVLINRFELSYSLGTPTEIVFDLEEVATQPAPTELPNNLVVNTLAGMALYTIVLPVIPANRRIVNYRGDVWLVWHTRSTANQSHTSDASLSFVEVSDPTGSITCIKVRVESFRTKIDQGRPVEIRADLSLA